MSNLTDHEVAERLSKRRARLVTVLALLFVGQQVLFVGKAEEFGILGEARAVDAVLISAWLVWAAMLLLLLGAKGGLFYNAKVRALIDDESTRAHRSAALAAGFWTMSVSAVALYFLSFYQPVNGRAMLHILLSAGVGVALLRFGRLEMEASPRD